MIKKPPKHVWIIVTENGGFPFWLDLCLWHYTKKQALEELNGWPKTLRVVKYERAEK